MKHFPIIELYVELNNGDLAGVGSDNNKVAIGTCNNTRVNVSNILLNHTNVSVATYQPTEKLGGSG